MKQAGVSSVLCPQKMSLEPGVGAPWLEGYPCLRAPTWATLPWETTSPRAPSGTLEIQGWRLHAWAGQPGLGQFCQAARLTPSGLPSSSLPLNLGLTPCPLGSGAHPQAEPALRPCPELGRGLGVQRTCPPARSTTQAPEASEAPSSPESSLARTQC